MNNYRVHPFTNEPQAVLIEEVFTVPAGSDPYLPLQEFPLPGTFSLVEVGNVVELACDQDCYIYEGSSFTNYNTTFLQTGKDGVGNFYRYRGLLRFNLSPLAGLSLESANLRLKLRSTAGSGGYPTQRQIGVHRANASWSETGTSWSNAPGYNVVAESVRAVTTEGFYEWNILSLVNSWKSGTFANNGLFIVDGNENESDTPRQFWSRSAPSSDRPTIQVTTQGNSYTEVPKSVPPPLPGEYQVNYQRPYIRWSSADSGKQFCAKYYGLGSPVRT